VISAYLFGIVENIVDSAMAIDTIHLKSDGTEGSINNEAISELPSLEESIRMCAVHQRTYSCCSCLYIACIDDDKTEVEHKRCEMKHEQYLPTKSNLFRKMTIQSLTFCTDENDEHQTSTTKPRASVSVPLQMLLYLQGSVEVGQEKSFVSS
jgi:hypothetical protein